MKSPRRTPFFATVLFAAVLAAATYAAVVEVATNGVTIGGTASGTVQPTGAVFSEVYAPTLFRTNVFLHDATNTPLHLRLPAGNTNNIQALADLVFEELDEHLDDSYIKQWPTWYKLGNGDTNETPTLASSSGLFLDGGSVVLENGIKGGKLVLRNSGDVDLAHASWPTLEIRSDFGSVDIVANGKTNYDNAVRIYAPKLRISPTNGSPEGTKIPIVWNGVTKTGWDDIGADTNAILAVATNHFLPAVLDEYNRGYVVGTGQDGFGAQDFDVTFYDLQAYRSFMAGGANFCVFTNDNSKAWLMLNGDAITNWSDITWGYLPRSWTNGNAGAVIGNSSTATAPNSFATGRGLTASGNASVAMGVDATAGQDYAFTWSGVASAWGGYASHGKGSFNANPSGGETNFWVGTNTLGGLLDQRATTGSVASVERRLVALESEYWCKWTSASLSSNTTYKIPTNWPARTVYCHVFCEQQGVVLAFPDWTPDAPCTLHLVVNKASGGGLILQTANGSVLQTMTSSGSIIRDLVLSFVPSVGWVTAYYTLAANSHVVSGETRSSIQLSLLPEDGTFAPVVDGATE